MPTYEFRCPDGHEFDRFFKTISTAPTELPCPECGVVAERQLSAGAGLVFKGSGFYLTDYGKNAHRADAGGRKGEGSGEGGSSEKSDGGERAGKQDGAKSESAKSESAKSESAKSDGAKGDAKASSAKPAPAKAEPSASSPKADGTGKSGPKSK